MKKVHPDIYEGVMEAYFWACGFSDCYEKAVDLCHKLSKTKKNIEKYPLFIHSPMNLIPGCRKHHEQKNHTIKITEREAEIYERYLEGVQKGKYK